MISDQSWHAYFMSDKFYAKGLLVSADGTKDVSTLPESQNEIDINLNLQSTIRSYQQRGHLVADLDPLGIISYPVCTDLGVPMRANESVTRKYLKFQKSDLEKQFQLPDSTLIGGANKSMKLKDIIERLENIYCKKIGLEYTFIADTEQVDWIKSKFEPPGIRQFSKEQKILTLERLTRATRYLKVYGIRGTWKFYKY